MIKSLQRKCQGRQSLLKVELPLLGRHSLGELAGNGPQIPIYLHLVYLSAIICLFRNL